MSEDRLEKALQAMKEESANPELVSEAGARVWEKLDNSDSTLCSEFQDQLRDYLDGRLAENRRLLVEDHLVRCPSCRARLAQEKGEQNVVPMPARRRAWPKWATWAAAAAVFCFALYLGRDALDNALAPRGPRATVASTNGGLYAVSKGILKAGAEIYENAVIRTGPGAHAVLRLRDGSLVDLNEHTELTLHAVWSGQSVRLQRGDIIVRAAKQHRGRHLFVETRDSVASVRGTIFAVSAGFSGSLVSVVEGSVAVTQPGTEVMLSPGEQSASNAALMTSVQDAISWSPDAATYIEMLASVAKIEKQLASIPFPLLRTQSNLLGLSPANMVVYGAVPNLSGTIDQAVTLAEQQSSENPAFNQWWSSGAGVEMKKLIYRIQTVTPLLGDEIVYGICLPQSGTVRPIPVLLAEVRQGKRTELAAALDNLGLGGSGAYNLTDTVMSLSNSAANLQWMLDHAGEGASTPFAEDIAARYKDGAAWMLGIDMNSILEMSGAAQNGFIQAQNVKHLFLEQRTSQGAEENELTVSFKGPRTGLASILASTGSGGAAEYLSRDSILAVYASTREPQQIFEELAGQMSRFSPDFQRHLAEAEARLGVSFSNDVARAFGTESAFAVESFAVTGPVWTMIRLVNDPVLLDITIQKLIDSINAELARSGRTERIRIEQETADGRTWKTLRIPSFPVAITWTYDRGYMIAASDRGAATRAIATRNGGSALVWSPAFQQQLSPSAGLHPSAFAWLNTNGALSNFASMTENPAIKKLLAERDPVLVLFSGTMEQIRAVSRTRVTGIAVNLLLMQGMGRAAAQPGMN